MNYTNLVYNFVVLSPPPIPLFVKHPAFLRGQRAADNFSDLYLRDDVISALKEVGVTKPTVIQMLAIPKIVRGKHVLCAAETGVLACLHAVHGQDFCVYFVSYMLNDEDLGRH